MNSLEFINKEIAIIKSKYKEHLKFNQTSLAIKDEKRLKYLQQIKEELEAWEIVKNKKVDLLMFEIYHDRLQEYNNYVKETIEDDLNGYENFLLNEEEATKLKKAMKVKNDK